MSNKYNSSNIQSITNKKIFLDANILIYLFGFGTPTSSNWESQYANLYTKLHNILIYIKIYIFGIYIRSSHRSKTVMYHPNPL